MAATSRVNRETKPKTYDYRAAPGVTQAPANEITVSPFAVTVLDDEPRVRDLDLAERLGFSRPRAIRQMIERNRAELEAYGPLATLRGKSRGQDFTEYYPNEEQSLLISTLSNTPAASAVRRALITTFVALRRGQAAPALVHDDRKVIGGIMKAVVHKELVEAVHELLPALVAQAITDQQYGVVRGLTAGDVIELAGVKDRKGLKSIPRRVSDRLRQYHAEQGAVVNRATLGCSTAYIFDQATTKRWLDEGGKAMIHQWVSEKRGQGVLKLVPKGA